MSLGLALALCGSAIGGVVTSQSSVGIAADYNSNPFLVPTQAQSAESGAVLANVPISYAGDTQSFDLTPRLRFAGTRGAEAVLSDYQYLDADWHLTSERNTLTVSGFWHHDTTFYNPFEDAALHGRDLKRLEQTGTVDWARALDERSKLHLTASWDQMAYSQSTQSGLENYTYDQGALQYARDLSERWQWTSSLGVGRYAIYGNAYTSDNEFAQTAVSGKLTELWSISAQVGYSKLSSATVVSEYKIVQEPNGQYVIVQVPVDFKASAGTGSYAFNLQRQYERMVLGLTATRTLQPSGLGALLTQDDVSFTASLPRTERLTLTGTLHAMRLADSLEQLIPGGRKYYDVDFGLSWRLNERWNLQVSSSYSTLKLDAQTPWASGVSAYLLLLRQIDPIRL